MGEHVKAGDGEIWVERQGGGPDVLLIGGLGDPAEAWQAQLDGLADRYRLTAFDNRGAGRTALGDGPLSSATMADDAAALLRALEVPSAHVAGFSMGSSIAQELALRHPELVRSLVLVSAYARPDALVRSIFDFWRWMPNGAPSDRAFYEAFFTWVYTPRAHDEGLVESIVEEGLAFPHQQSEEGFLAQVDACAGHDTADRLPQIAAPTLVISGEQDVLFPPRFGEFIAEQIPGARFDLLPGQAHQPFQEAPDDFNARVGDFWREVEARG
ncbi:MAG TPA: alpha/beta fold hydrolase [Solirubrobacterales bacterium]